MKKTTIYLCLSSVIIFILFLLGLMIGRYSISFVDFFKAIFNIDSSLNMQRSIINFRLSRTIVAALSGMSLTIAGFLYQELFQNKLISPNILGVSSGASVGAAIAIVLGLSSILVCLLSFLFGLITIFLTLLFATIFKNRVKLNLLLSGVIVSGLMISLLSFIKYSISNLTILADIIYWLMGSFAHVTMTNVWIMLPIVLICLMITLVISWRINIICLGRSQTLIKGINYDIYKYLIIGISTLLTSVTVASCGTIAWIGLIVPHIVRIIVKKNGKQTFWLCITFGGGLMILTDILSRSFTSSEIPLSAITSLFGIIAFVLIVVSRRKKISYYD